MHGGLGAGELPPRLPRGLRGPSGTAVVEARRLVSARLAARLLAGWGPQDVAETPCSMPQVHDEILSLLCMGRASEAPALVKRSDGLWG